MKTITHKPDRRDLQRGFSLIELIVVLVILGLLATVVGTQVIPRLAESKRDIAKVQIAELGGALELFRFDVGRFPNSSEGLQALIEGSGIENWGGPYLKKSALPKDPWGRDYEYRYPGQNGTDYDLWSYGADGREGGEDDAEDVTSWQ